jgi:zinc protease
VPRAAGTRITIDMPDKPQSDIAYGFTSIGRMDPAYYAHWMMNTILGQFGLGGRLAENIRERQGMAYYVYSAFDPSVGPGPLVVRAGVDPGNVERALAAIDAEVAALGRDGATVREFDETRQYLIGSIPRMLETNAGIAAFLQTAEFFGPRARLRSPSGGPAAGGDARGRERRGGVGAGSGARVRGGGGPCLASR